VLCRHLLRPLFRLLPDPAVLISASYRTDIPAFYGEWFVNRLRAGFCRVVNPYGGPPSSVSLRVDDVDGFVFWTKNAGPFLPRLAEVRDRGFPFVLQYTINGYPRALEYAVVDPEKSVEHARRVAGEYGPRVVVWRYDTVVFSSVTPRDSHLRNFERLATALSGSTDEVVISFAQIYRKTRTNMGAAARLFGFAWEDPDDAEKMSLARELAACARARGMQLTVCSQARFLEPGIEPARCIDAARMEQVAGRPIRARRKGNRPECACHESRDIGEYDTCPHGCVYCYAVRTRALARRRYRVHDPAGEFLCRPPQSTLSSTIFSWNPPLGDS
jgi:Domain of unknown function (DUF1848)